MGNFNVKILLNNLSKEEKSPKRLILKAILASMADDKGRVDFDMSEIVKSTPYYKTRSLAEDLDDLVSCGDIAISHKLIYLKYLSCMNVAVEAPEMAPTGRLPVTDHPSGPSATPALASIPALPPDTATPPADSESLSLADAVLWGRWLARQLALTVRSNYLRHGVTVPKTFLDSQRKKDKWVNELKLMIRDGISPMVIYDIIKFLRVDAFWSRNILSAEKLREKCVALQMAMSKNKPVSFKQNREKSRFAEMAELERMHNDSVN